MPSPSSSSAQAARQRLAIQLREMRQAAKLSGVEFARLAGWSNSTNVTKVETAVRPASAEYVLLWCRLCGASGQRTEELLAEQRAVAGMWVTHRQANRAGLRAVQEAVRDQYWRVKHNRVYQTKVIPGLLQTEAMTTHYLTTARLDQHLEVDDVAEAVAARMGRQRCLGRPEARWLFVVEEDVLWFRPAEAEVHREQLQHLLEVMRWPTVSLGIIPRTAERHGVCPEESFTMVDSELVSVELVSGYLNVTQPYEIQMYLEAWARLSPLAVHGEKARVLILAAQKALEERPGA